MARGRGGLTPACSDTGSPPGPQASRDLHRRINADLGRLDPAAEEEHAMETPRERMIGQRHRGLPREEVAQIILGLVLFALLAGFWALLWVPPAG